MASLRDIGRVVFGHGWQDPSEWARAVDALADLSDEEIECLVENTRQRRLAGAAWRMRERGGTSAQRRVPLS